MSEQILGFLGLMRRAAALAVGAEDAFDAARENDVIRRNAARVEDPVLRSFYVLFLKEQMNCAKKYEQRLLQGRCI